MKRLLGRSDRATSRHRRYDVTALFEVLDGQTFHHYDDLVDAVLALMNTNLSEFPVSYSYRDAMVLAERRGWLNTGDNGRSVTVACGTTEPKDQG